MKNDRIREQVSGAYKEALRKSREGGGCCCSSGAPSVPFGVAAKHAGYTSELEAHADAARSSFGCGNPLAFAGVREGETVLDLGSGAGLDLLIAARKVGPSGRVIGVDMTDEMLEAARAHAAGAGFDNVELRKGVIEKLPVADDSVDWVISNCVVNLSPEKQRVFAEIHRVLRPGGRFSISDIVAGDLPEALRELAEVYAACIGGAISESEYVAGLEAAGLSEVTVSERLFYDAEALRGLIGSEIDWSDASVEVVAASLPGLEGKVASVRLSGRKPA
jgi:ubiquinone/menaquinone biosynthesis C-methylase UbiE